MQDDQCDRRDVRDSAGVTRDCWSLADVDGISAAMHRRGGAAVDRAQVIKQMETRTITAPLAWAARSRNPRRKISMECHLGSGSH
jgi:hypothetical protein